MALISKIWLLGGWFYLALVFLTALFFLINKKQKIYLSDGILVGAAVFAIFISLQSMAKQFQTNTFLDPIGKKIDKTTFSQFSYAKHLNAILPKGANGCLYWSFDLATYYLQKELYPHRFSTLGDGLPFGECKYVISQFRPRVDEKLRLIDSYQNNYLYEVMN